jgi:AraC-like DNA-binding protein
MPPSDKQLSETDIRSPRSKAWIVRADVSDARSWLGASPVCPLLGHYQIAHTAVAHLPAPFEIVRTRLGGSYFLACLGGEGRVLVDGRWFRCRPGIAVLLPPGTLQAFHTPLDKDWDVCWVRYQERSGQRPLATAQTPVIAKYDAEPLRLAILGLHHESSGMATPAALERWAMLVHHYVLQFAKPAGLDERLWRLWDKVSRSLGQPWTLADMSRETHLSEKQLQRLCRQQLGRTPRQQLIWLRMRRAADLLVERSMKIETIAAQVGYENPFAFSTTFKQVMGWPPSEYPSRRS